MWHACSTKADLELFELETAYWCSFRLVQTWRFVWPSFSSNRLFMASRMMRVQWQIFTCVSPFTVNNAFQPSFNSSLNPNIQKGYLPVNFRSVVNCLEGSIESMCCNRTPMSLSETAEITSSTNRFQNEGLTGAVVLKSSIFDILEILVKIFVNNLSCLAQKPICVRPTYFRSTLTNTRKRRWCMEGY